MTETKNHQILKGLNAKQAEAVKTIDGPVLVISGPGSGKTKALTHRVAWMIASGIHPGNILAITFTNKAAAEMRDRIGKLLAGAKKKIEMPTIGTFHAIGMRILRREIPVLGYGQNFSILGPDEQLSLMKRIMGAFEIDPKRYNPRTMLNKISKLKTELIWPEDYVPKDHIEKLVAKLYTQYQHDLKVMNGLDFDDLIVLTVRIFKENANILAKYQTVWKYIMVDEYQDTSHDQYQFVQLLAKANRNIFAIGDDAQSIYAFREADIRNILNFQKDYPDAKVIMLEQNYRSTQNILDAAQSIISKNQNQFPKKLWTENEQGEKILVKETLNERTEANFVIGEIVKGMRRGFKINDFTILYRTHAQSRALEEALITHKLPYQIVGGLKFYERKEIKDILGYLKFIHNTSDVLSFERIYNVPGRGIGPATYEKVLATGKKNLFEGLDQFIDTLKGGKSEILTKFRELLRDLMEFSKKNTLTKTIKYIVESVDYESYLRQLAMAKNAKIDNVEERMENIQELLTVARSYDHLEPEEGPPKAQVRKSWFSL